MTARNAFIRVLAGVFIVLALYVGPFVVGVMTAADRLSPCLERETGAADIVIKLGFIPSPAELEHLQRFGRYGGSGGNLNNVILLNVPKESLRDLSQTYWISEIEPTEECVL